jgi:hypothetical protein
VVLYDPQTPSTEDTTSKWLLGLKMRNAGALGNPPALDFLCTDQGSRRTDQIMCALCYLYNIHHFPKLKVDVALAGAQIYLSLSHTPSAKGEIKIARRVSGGHWQSRTNFDTRAEGWSRVSWKREDRTEEPWYGLDCALSGLSNKPRNEIDGCPQPRSSHGPCPRLGIPKLQGAEDNRA